MFIAFLNVYVFRFSVGICIKNVKFRLRLYEDEVGGSIHTMIRELPSMSLVYLFI